MGSSPRGGVTGRKQSHPGFVSFYSVPPSGYSRRVSHLEAARRDHHVFVLPHVLWLTAFTRLSPPRSSAVTNDKPKSHHNCQRPCNFVCLI